MSWQLSTQMAFSVAVASLVSISFSMAAPALPTPRISSVVHIIDGIEVEELVPEKKTTIQAPLPEPSWPSGDYCLLAGTAGTCPEDFVIGSINLAVPVNIGLGEMYRNGNEFENYVKVGRVGGVELSMLPYDQIYSLKLSACCRLPPTEPPPPYIPPTSTEMPFIKKA